jgi:hypothetical protein
VYSLATGAWVALGRCYPMTFIEEVIVADHGVTGKIVNFRWIRAKRLIIIRFSLCTALLVLLEFPAFPNGDKIPLCRFDGLLRTRLRPLGDTFRRVAARPPVVRVLPRRHGAAQSWPRDLFVASDPSSLKPCSACRRPATHALPLPDRDTGTLPQAEHDRSV